jgi:hypothetical protein
LQRSSLVRRLIARGRDVAQLGQPPLVSLADGDQDVAPGGERSTFLVLELETARGRGDIGGQEVDGFDRTRDLARRSLAERLGVVPADRITPANDFPVRVEEFGVVGESSGEPLGVRLVVGVRHSFE